MFYFSKNTYNKAKNNKLYVQRALFIEKQSASPVPTVAVLLA